MRTDDERAEHAKYMREYTARNKDAINARRREKLRLDKIENPEKYKKLRERCNKANKKYHDENREEINSRAKDNNWYFDAERAKINRAKHYRKHPARNVLRQRKAFAERNNLPFELTTEWYHTNYKLNCAVTGIPFETNGSDTPWVPHIDRIVPDKGYTPDNCRLVCAPYNLAKKHWTDDDVLTMAKLLLNPVTPTKPPTRFTGNITDALKYRRSFAKKHNLPFELTSEWYEEQFELGCQVTGLPFDDNGSDTPWVPHIDRIIPDKGYTVDNCRLVCGCFNLAKKHWTDDDVLTMAKALLEYNT